jgi:hypothetical protein
LNIKHLSQNRVKLRKKSGEPEIDTAGKSKKQIRQEKRALKKLEKERQKELRDKGLM